MAKYRKRPVVIEARQYDGSEASRDEILLWGDKADTPMSAGTDWLSIETLEGTLRVSVGDFVIRGVKGELYPCKPDVFAATYELVAEPYKKIIGGIVLFFTLVWLVVTLYQVFWGVGAVPHRA
jgi:hypothetical protein